MTLINCAIIGFGNWGKVVYKSILKNHSLKLKYIFYNKNIDTILIKNNIILSDNYKVFNKKEIDLIFICTNSNLNFKLTKYFLSEKINVFCEKPMAFKAEEVKQIIKLSKKQKKVVVEDFIHTHNSNFIHFTKLFKSKYTKNNLEIINFEFGNNGPIRKNISPLWDWGPHVFSCLYILLSSFKKISIGKINLEKNSDGSKTNYNIELRDQFNSKIKLRFGNNFNLRKNKIFFKTQNEKYVYNDKYILKEQKQKKRRLNFIKKDPLTCVINSTLKKMNTKNHQVNNISLEVVKILEKIDKKINA